MPYKRRTAEIKEKMIQKKATLIGGEGGAGRALTTYGTSGGGGNQIDCRKSKKGKKLRTKRI